MPFDWLIFFHAVFNIGFIAVTTHLKAAVAVRVAATDTTAVVVAVTKISFSGKGICLSVNGISICLIPGASGSFSDVVLFGGSSACKSLGGITKGT